MWNARSSDVRPYLALSKEALAVKRARQIRCRRCRHFKLLVNIHVIRSVYVCRSCQFIRGMHALHIRGTVILAYEVTISI